MSEFEQKFNDSSSPQPGRGVVVSGLELWQWWQEARQQAIAAHVPISEVDWLLQEMTTLQPLDLRLETFKAQQQITLKHSLDVLTNLWQQRLVRRVPVQYLAGSTSWRNFSLKVSPAVLIPRPETELLIDLAVAAVQNSKFKIQNSKFSTGDWADLGTGSGAIALGLATAFPEATIHAVDCSAEALAIARANAEAYGLGDRIHFYQGSWLEPLSHLKGQLSGLVANPPYIPSAMVLELQPEIMQHEPHLALDGGADGLNCIRHLINSAPDYLQTNGIWLIEMMAGQAPTVVELLEQEGSYHSIEVHADLAGIERFVLAYRL
jgi:release factor glutamine methyltransferase